MSHTTHSDHTHVHSADCGHLRVQHGDHVGYLHDGHLHFPHQGHYDEHAIEVSETNPADCAPVACACGCGPDCGHPAVPHGDHVDYLVNGRLHHPHNGHCDDHGPLALAA